MQYIYRFESMSSPCELILYVDDKIKADNSAIEILQEAKRLEKKYSYYDKKSLLYRINSRSINELDQETISLLSRAKNYYKSTNKIFDITIATIKDLYLQNFALKELEQKKSELLEYVGCEHFSIKRDKIIFDNEFTKIDLGGFVKEYAVDRAAVIVKKYKIKSALINFGGDIYAVGKKPNGEKFKIGIKDPDNRNRYASFVVLKDEALTTSASYERNYKIEDQTFSHIISKNSSKNTPKSVSVIAKSCVESGVYSTSLMIDLKLEVKYRVILL